MQYLPDHKKNSDTFSKQLKDSQLIFRAEIMDSPQAVRMIANTMILATKATTAETTSLSSQKRTWTSSRPALRTCGKSWKSPGSDGRGFAAIAEALREAEAGDAASVVHV